MLVRAEVKSVRHKPSPLVQGGLEIPIEVTVKWQNRKAMDINFAGKSRSWEWAEPKEIAIASLANLKIFENRY